MSLGCVAVALRSRSIAAAKVKKDAANLLLTSCKPCTTLDRRTNRICSALHQTMEERQSQCCCRMHRPMEDATLVEVATGKIQKSPILYKC